MSAADRVGQVRQTYADAATIAAAPLADLLRTAYRLTHQMHEVEASKGRATTAADKDICAAELRDLRKTRDAIDLVIAHRIDQRDDLLREAERLLGDSRYQGADPGLSRSYGQTKRRVRDRILSLLAGA